MARSTPINGGYSIINGTGSGSNGNRIDVWLEYIVAEQDIANNRSRIIVQLYAALNPAYSSNTYGGNSCYSSLSVNGASGWNLKSNSAYDFRSSSAINHLGSYEGWVTHNSDGTLTISINGSFSTSSSWISGGSVSGNVTLPTIPRASSISAPSFTLGTAGNITITPAAAGFKHTLIYNFGTASGTIVSKTSDTTVAWTPPLSLANQIPNSVNGSGLLICDTYSGDTLVGTKKINLIASVPATVVPTVSLAVTKTSSKSIINTWNKFVKGFSKAVLAASAAGAYSSTIKSYYFAVKKGTSVKFSTTQSSASWTANTFTEDGDYTFYVKVTDSRGRIATYTTGVHTVYDYSQPSISGTDAFRCNSGGTKDLVNGTYLSAKGTFNYSAVGGSNTITKKIEYRRYGTSSYSMGNNSPANNTHYVFGGGGINIAYSYEVRFSITDDITGTITYTRIVKPGFVTMHVRPGGKGIGFGGAASADEFQVYMKAKFFDNIYINGLDMTVEMGVWTPTIYGDVSAGAPVYTNQGGRYVRIGSTVHLFGRIEVSNKGGIDGALYIGGLPYVSGYHSAGSIGAYVGISASALSLQMDSGWNYLSLRMGTARAGSSAIPSAEFALYGFEITYRLPL